MTPTPQLNTKLRKYLNEIIPPGGNESDTKFTDEEINDMIDEAPNIYSAASVGWTIKAGMFHNKIEKYQAGQESYDLTSLKDQYSHALAMAKQYSSMASGDAIIEPPMTGFILGVKAPGVL